MKHGMQHNLTMSRYLRKICFKFFGRLVLLGIATCVLMAFIGPCFTTHFNQTGVDSEEGVARFQAGGRNAIPSIQEGVENDKQKLMGKSAMHDVEVVPKSVKKSTSSNSKMKDENHKQNHLQGEQSKNNNIPAVKKMSYHSKNNRTKIVGRHGLPQDKISSGVTVNKTSWGQNLTQLDDIFIGVKTGGVYHDKRLNLLLETWVTTAKNQTFMFTDTDDEEYIRKTGGHLINTHCGHDHSRKALCCKMGVMFDTYVKKNKRWFCHLDDDNYLNTRNLVSYLQQYNAEKQDIYVGFTQLRKPITTNDKKWPGQQFQFYFGTGGAGFCISTALANKMKPYMCNGSFVDICDRIRWPDDMAIGFIVEVLVNGSLIIEDKFNSHIQALGNIRPEQLTNQITLSYKIEKKYYNTIHLPKGVFNTTVDPTRFRSLHCMLYPETKGCPKHNL